MSKKYTNIDELRDEIYSITLSNIEKTKKLYKKLIPDGENVNINLITVNSEQAVNCLKVIKENADTLLKLFAEINKKDSSKESNFVNLKIYDMLDEIGARPNIREIKQEEQEEIKEIEN